MWRWLLILMLPLPAAANDIMWTGKGEVMQGNSHFGVGARDPIDIVVRYAPEKRTTSTTPVDTAYVARRIYHGNINLRVEVRSRTKAWIGKISTASYVAGNNNPFDVFSAAPTAPAPAPGGTGGDLITLRTNSANSATFERFDENSQFPGKGILLIFGDATRTFDLLSLKQFPGATLPKQHVNYFEGAVYSGSTANQFTFRIFPDTLTLGEYIPPLKLAIKRNQLGGVTLTFNAQQLVEYQLFTSSNLLDWIAQPGTHIGAKDGPQDIHLPMGSGPQFFRMRRLPSSQ